jgi:alpha-glucosidase (family GH31 glycosyl hydrolase)
VYLPAGRWYDFWSETIADGGREISRPVDLETMPLFVRTGAILPLGPVRQYTSEPGSGPLTMQVYPGADGAFTMYEDDGATFGYQRGDWMRIALLWNDRTRRLRIALAEGSRMRPPERRRFSIRLAGTQTTREVDFNGRAVEVVL